MFFVLLLTLLHLGVKSSIFICWVEASFRARRSLRSFARRRLRHRRLSGRWGNFSFHRRARPSALGALARGALLGRGAFAGFAVSGRAGTAGRHEAARGLKLKTSAGGCGGRTCAKRQATHDVPQLQCAAHPRYLLVMVLRLTKVGKLCTVPTAPRSKNTPGVPSRGGRTGVAQRPSEGHGKEESGLSADPENGRTGQKVGCRKSHR